MVNLIGPVISGSGNASPREHVEREGGIIDNNNKRYGEFETKQYLKVGVWKSIV